MSSLNKVFLMGRLGADPELRYTEAGTAIANMNIATSEYNSKTKKETTTWHKIVMFGKTAEACKEHLNKGSQVLVEGRIQNRTWEKDGQKRYITEILADRVQFLGGSGKKKQDAGSGDPADEDPPASDNAVDSGDMPF